MKYLFITFVLAAVSFSACKNGNTVAEEKKTADTGQSAPAATVTTNTTSGATTDIISQYLNIKNALTKDDGKEAAKGGKAMVESFAKFDQSSLSAEQKLAYDDIVTDAKEHAEHIGLNADKVAHQREHFATLSKDIYDLVKSLGSVQTLYQDHCPMYNNNKGANWLSETKEINNPYLGTKMPTCGSIKEILK